MGVPERGNRFASLPEQVYLKPFGLFRARNVA